MFGCFTNFGWVPIKQIKNEIIRVLCREMMSLKCFRWKVFQIERHDQVGSSLNGRGNHMSVIFIWQRYGAYQVLKIAYQTVPNVCIHEYSGSFEVLAFEVASLFENVSYPLLMNGVSPARPIKVCQGQTHEQVSEGGGVKHTRIIDDREV